MAPSAPDSARSRSTTPRRRRSSGFRLVPSATLSATSPTSSSAAFGNRQSPNRPGIAAPPGTLTPTSHSEAFGGVMNADLALLVLRVVVGGVVMQHGLLKLGLVGQGGSVKGVA